MNARFKLYSISHLKSSHQIQADAHLKFAARFSLIRVTRCDTVVYLVICGSLFVHLILMPVVGIKRILFADTNEVTADITPTVAKALIAAATTAGNEVLNVHGETWQIEEAEASVTSYKNQLNGQSYRYDTTPGDIIPSFSIGQYDYKTGGYCKGNTQGRNGGNVRQGI